MLNSMSLLVVSTALSGQVVAGGPVYPDGLDILRAADTLPQIQMILDSSCSMGWTASANPNCPYYEFVSGICPTCYSRLDLLKAAMTGCQVATDGILDLPFASRALFALRLFGTGGIDGLSTNGGFDTAGGNLAVLQNDILSMSASGGTPLGSQYAAGALYQTQFFRFDGTPGTCATTTMNGGTNSCNNTLECRQNYLVVMSDGESNGPSSSYNFVSGVPGVTVNDLSGSAPHTDHAAAYMVRDVSVGGFVPVDTDDDVVGRQDIRTYTVAFSAPAAAANLLQNMATAGLGNSYSPTTYGELAGAFQDIILQIIARSNVSFSPGTLQNEGLFSGNYVYQTSFRPFDRGYWLGTTKKYCVDPNLTGLGPSSAECLFLRSGGTATGALLTNPTPTDMWTLTNSQVATTGGTGQIVANQMGVNLLAPGTIPGAPYAGRKILTWAPGNPVWIRITDPSSITPTFTQTSGSCRHAELINKLFGYTDQTAGTSNCTGVAALPIAVDIWPVGDTINGSTTLIRYNDSCELGAGNCFLAVNSNDGMLHFYDTFNGREVTAVIPGHLWSDNLVAQNKMADIMDQPTLDEMRRYYFDGKSRLYHEDLDGNGNIDAGERAYLIVGLGRGGRQFLKFDVSTNFGGDPEATGVAPQALMVDDQQSSLRHLRETWNPMWVGNFRETVSQTVVPTGIFASGHDREDDIRTVDFGSGAIGGLPPNPVPATLTDNCNNASGCTAVSISPEEHALSTAIDTICTTLEGTLGISIPPLVRPTLCNPAQCTPCDTPNPMCTSGIGPLEMATLLITPTAKPCYDWAGWGTMPGSPLAGVGGGAGYTIPLGPFQATPGNGDKAFRINFSSVNMQPNDYISVTDSTGNEVVRYTGNAGAPTTPWIYDTNGFRFVITTDGVDDVAAGGWTIGSVEYQLGNVGPPSAITRKPSIYFVDLRSFNHDFASPPGLSQTSFNDVPTNNQQESAVLARITRDCSDSPASANGVCVDASMQPALAAMTCPISAEVTVFREGGLFRTAYVGDECGQIWAIDRTPSTTPPPGGFFRVRRLAHLNNVDATGMPLVGDAKDFRRIFTKLDVAVSTCTGSRRLGVYFGTGNVQRPALDLYLRNAAITTPPSVTPASIIWPAVTPGSDATGGTPDVDVFGVVWDDGVKGDIGLEDMFNATTVTQVDYTNGAFATQTQNGWYIMTGRDEKVLRDPLVIDGVAYFKTYDPTIKATECVSATGIDSVFAVDNCNAAPLGDTNGSGTTNANDRRVWQGQTDIGGNLMLYTPPDGPPVVTTGTPAPGGVAEPMLPSRPNRRAVRLFMWRLNVDPQF